MPARKMEAISDRGGRVTSNIAWLYAAHGARIGMALLLVPFLARLLGPHDLGLVAAAQAFAVFVTLIVEFGFDLSATRALARSDRSPATRARLVASVNSAKLLLGLVGVASAIVAAVAYPPFQEEPTFLVAALVLGLASGLVPNWYFQGQERMRVVASLDIAARALSLILILALVRSPDQSERVLVIQAASNVLLLLVVTAIVFRETRFLAPRIHAVMDAIKMGWSAFLFRSSVAVYGALNTMTLGYLAPPTSVGYFSGAERISRAGTSAIFPYTQALYPRVNRLAVNDRPAAARLARRSLLLALALGSLIAVGTFVFAPLIVTIALGPGFEPAIPVLRILGLLAPAIALTNVLGVHWMLPLGRDRAFNAIMLTTGFASIVLTILLVPRSGEQGVAWALVIAEASSLALMLAYLRWRHEDPLSMLARGQVPEISTEAT